MVALGFVAGCGVEEVFEGLESAAVFDPPLLIARVAIVVLQHQRGESRRALRFLMKFDFHGVEVLVQGKDRKIFLHFFTPRRFQGVNGV